MKSKNQEKKCVYLNIILKKYNLQQFYEVF